MGKNYFDNKLLSFNKKVTSKKKKNIYIYIYVYLEVQKILNSLTTKDYIFFLDRMYSQAMMDLKICLFTCQHLTC